MLFVNFFFFLRHFSTLKKIVSDQYMHSLNLYFKRTILLTNTLDLSTFSLISLMQACWRFCTVKLLVHPAISNRKVRSISMPLSVKSTSGWNCVPYSFFCSLAIPGGESRFDDPLWNTINRPHNTQNTFWTFCWGFFRCIYKHAVRDTFKQK